MTYTLASKPPDWFTLGGNVRQTNSPAYAEPELRFLGESMGVRQIEPVGASPDGVLRWGFRRVLAARLVGLESVLAVIADDDLSESGWKLLALQENLLRAEMTDAEVYLGCKELLALNPDWRNIDLAQHLHLPAYEVTRILAADAAIPEVRAAFLEGRITRNDIYTISRSPDAEQLALLDARRNGASSKQLSRRRRPEDAAAASVRVTRLSCPMPGGAAVAVSGAGLSLQDAIEVAQEWIKEARRAADQGLDAKTFQAVMRDKAKKGDLS